MRTAYPADSHVRAPSGRTSAPISPHAVQTSRGIAQEIEKRVEAGESAGRVVRARGVDYRTVKKYAAAENARERSMTYKGARGMRRPRSHPRHDRAISGLWQGLGFSGHAAHIGIMVRTAANIRFDVRPMKTGQTWMVVVTFPDRAEMQVTDFGTEADARKWIANESQAWLRKLGYGND
jgi:hypothetical protein